MAGRSGYPTGNHASPGVFRVEGSFVCNGTTAPATVRGAGYTVSAPAAGIFTLTMKDDFLGIIKAIADLAEGTADQRARVITVSTGSPTTVTVATQRASGTDATMTTSAEVHFGFAFRDTGRTA